MALANSPLLQRAEARVEQARGRVIQAGLYPNPRYDGGNPHQLGGSQSLYNTGITQPVVTGGQIAVGRGDLPAGADPGAASPGAATL